MGVKFQSIERIFPIGDQNTKKYYRAPGGLKADLGPYVSGRFPSGFSRYFQAGLYIDSDTIPLSQYPGGFGIGSSQTVSIIALLKTSLDRILREIVSFYGSLGGGFTL